jgi:glycosyltransferase involved in cell wall biosynthesis
VEPQKDHGTFLRAAAHVAAARDGVTFVLAGRGADAANRRLTGLVRAAGLEGRVRLLGVRRDMPTLTAALDVAVLSSAFGEGLSNSMGEAMACGVPCVVTDVGDSARLVGTSGVVAPARDADALAAGVLSVLARPAHERRALGAEARRRIVDGYSLPAVTARYAELYQEVLADVRHRRRR